MTRTLAAGDLIANRYRLEAVLDNTLDWTCVWFGEDTLLLRPVTVRTLDPTHKQTADVLTAARAAASVDDAGFIRILDISNGEDAGTEHIVSSFIQAELVADILTEGSLDPIEAADLIADIAACVAHAHDKGLIHGSLDPVHVLVAPGGEAAIINLGVAQAISNNDQASIEDDVRHLGALLYACLTSRWPLSGVAGIPAAVVEKGHVIAPRKARANVPHALDQLCRRALGEVVGDDAPIDSAREFAVALRSFLGRSGTTASQRLERRQNTGPIKTVEKIRKRGVGAIIIAVVAILLAGLIYLGFEVLNTTLGEPNGSPAPGPQSGSSP
ncbi:unannotated protein [freshwater metagenome]|uniref:Unannotated protein n=1 Tax=freshwater metagenome TaxID=449393 RepID=A0A6J7D8Y6_9ZZZZ|nr:hypothetical protein [Actinomycetota bacterium]